MAMVLIVDDESPIIELLADLARDMGHGVVLASNGQQALAQAHACVPALVLSDVMMPVMNGYALLEALRSNVVFIHTQIYLMSAGIRAPTPTAIVQPDGFLSKPFDLMTIELLFAQLA